jgi:hypothetical protein
LRRFATPDAFAESVREYEAALRMHPKDTTTLRSFSIRPGISNAPRIISAYSYSSYPIIGSPGRGFSRR